MLAGTPVADSEALLPQTESAPARAPRACGVRCRLWRRAAGRMRSGPQCPSRRRIRVTTLSLPPVTPAESRVIIRQTGAAAPGPDCR